MKVKLMVLESYGKISFQAKSRSAVLYIPSSLAQDSQFPLKIGEKVKISIKGSKLIIESVE
jgi:antitoxin component of MazEF toxin-antitoxin module